MTDEPLDPEDADVDMDTGDFGHFEVRLRDPIWLTEDNAQELRSSYERAECCWDRCVGVAEVPRARRVGTKIVPMQPARFRLCAFHAATLLDGDPEATFHVSEA